MRRGFSLIEIIVAVTIVSLLAVAATLSLAQQRARARDTKRISDISTLQVALENYIGQNGGAAVADNDSSNWDLSSLPGTNPSFMSFLQTAGLISKTLFDPINDAPDSATGFAYRYQYFTNGGYLVNGIDYRYYIIEAQKMETSGSSASAKQQVSPN